LNDTDIHINFKSFILGVACNSLLSGFEHSQGNLTDYANIQITHSYNFLLLSTHFGTFSKNRPGFAKVYKDLSDKAWNNAIDLIKYVTKRGGKMTFKQDASKKITEAALNEDKSLGYALDTQKDLAMEARRIHQHASHANCQNYYDPAVAHYVEEKFFEEQTETVRNLAGYANDLNKLLKNTNTNQLATYLFDEYLQKQ
jgi:ferritin heavy chain